MKKSSTSHVNAKENEIKSSISDKNTKKSEKKPVLVHKNVSNSEEKCVKEMSNVNAKNEQNKFFDTGDHRVMHDVMYLDAASKNSGVINE